MRAPLSSPLELIPYTQDAGQETGVLNSIAPVR